MFEEKASSGNKLAQESTLNDYLIILFTNGHFFWINSLEFFNFCKSLLIFLFTSLFFFFLLSHKFFISLHWIEGKRCWKCATNKVHKPIFKSIMNNFELRCTPNHCKSIFCLLHVFRIHFWNHLFLMIIKRIFWNLIGWIHIYRVNHIEKLFFVWMNDWNLEFVNIKEFNLIKILFKLILEFQLLSDLIKFWHRIEQLLSKSKFHNAFLLIEFGLNCAICVKSSKYR